MILDVEKPEVQLEGVDVEHSFGVNTNDLPYLLDIVANRMYSNKPLAVVREYSCNGLDAQFMSGNADKPLKVSLPNALQPNFVVRDFGTGLSDDSIKDIYAKYGRSTKRDSNQMIGSLGLGSKSAFAYSDSFGITSYFNGTKIVYHAYIDPTRVGKIAKLIEEPTTEPNGIEISVPVKSEDFANFRLAAQSVYRFFKIKPEVSGLAGYNLVDFQNALKEQAAMFEGVDWKISGTGESYAVMGSIGYPLNKSALEQAGVSCGLTAFLSFGAILTFNIGDLEIAASREALEYKTKTVDAIKAKLQLISDEISKTVANSFTPCKTILEAKLLYSNTFGYNGKFRNLPGVSRVVVWKGKTLTESEPRLNTNDTVAIVFTKDIHGKIISRPCASLNYRENNFSIVINDTGAFKKVKGRIASELQTATRVYLLTFKDAASQDQWIKDEQMEGIKLKSLSQLTYIKLSASVGGVYSKKHAAEKFSLNFSATNSGKPSDYWDVEDIDFKQVKDGVYVVLSRFSASFGGRNESPWDLRSLLSQLTNAGVGIPKIYGFKESYDLTKIPKGWRSLDKFAAEELSKIILTEKIADKIQEREEANSVSASIQKISKRKTELSATGASRTFLDALDEMQHSNESARINQLQALAKGFGVSLPSGKSRFNLGQLVADCEAKYPLWSVLEEIPGYQWQYETSIQDKIIQYFNSID
jgi:hypothetical protein